ncbi:hypothetical protein [Ideonella paludis]|uniref:Uncharacterized protein n=1 Tax=Ideonella paludis TaxID=1233411 RepID=A0ABS5DSE5_9BURK|nr:hypothetical protein [Ideonella paludis]MBQ0934068.1 hypothetical protein [Ideonella paludis]
MQFLSRFCALALTALSVGTTQAAEPYAAIGAPGVMLGIAQPVSDTVTVRLDLATIGTRDKSGVEQGINYKGQYKSNRTGLFADWFVAGGFRLTGGVTVNDTKFDLTAFGDGTPIKIGNTSYATTTADRFVANIKFPSTTPYIGIGWGHKMGNSGWGFVADLGASIGKATVATRVEGPLLSQVSQADLDRETQELRDGVGKVRALPQLSVGVSYQF